MREGQRTEGAVTPYWSDDLITLYHANDLRALAEVGEGTVDLVFTSPPYNLGNTTGGGFADPEKDTKAGKWSGGKLASGYANHDDEMPHEEYVEWQQTLLRTLWEKLSSHGAIFYNHKPRLKDKELWLPLELNPGLPLRQIIIWSRAGGMNFSPTHYCPTHEWIMLFAKPDFKLKSRGASGAGDVWQVPQEPSPHPAPFPIGLPARAIETMDGVRTVLDPYSGSGTTVRAAADAGVKGIGIDNDKWCLDYTIERLAQQSLFS